MILITHQTAQRYAAARFLFVAQLLLIAFEVEAVEQISGFMGQPRQITTRFHSFLMHVLHKISGPPGT